MMYHNGYDLKDSAIALALLTLLTSSCSSTAVDSIGIDAYGTLLSPFESLQGSTNNSQRIESQKQPECGVWLAPSTITGAGLGMFAGKYFEENEEILPSGDSIVAIIDYPQHTAANSKSDLTFLWDEYVWNAEGLSVSGEGRFEVNVASPGLGSAANSFLPIYNVDEWYPVKDSVGLHRSRDPGAGGFSLLYNRKSTAKTEISAGQELFVSYGASWFKSRKHFGPIPLNGDFDRAQKLIDRFKTLQNSVGKDLASVVWDKFVKSTIFNESRVIGAFHHSDVLELEILTTENKTLRELRIEQSLRPLAWLQQHGTCGDHITVGPSTLKQAGRGAFASRSLPQNTIVAQLPMIHITDRAVLEMYNFVHNKSGNEFIYSPSKTAGLMGYQMLLNYCFGHRESTLLLCPYGPLTNYINHNQSLANVNVRWGRQETGNHMPELLEKNISAFSEDKTAKFAMELVALRDIAEGEEIFFDYGDEWEQAWEEHVRAWTPMDGAAGYVSSSDLNGDTSTRLQSIFEQLNETAPPFPPNVELKCDKSFSSTYEDDWREHYENGTLDHFLEFHEPDFWSCVILRSEVSEDGSYFYTVHMYAEKDDEDDEEDAPARVDSGWKEKNLPAKNIIALNFPREAFRFYDIAYTDDTFLPNAFHHDIRIPDELFPLSWRNLMV